MTKKSELFLQRIKEKRNSRIKETRNFIVEKTNGSLMNNRKWLRVFELIEQRNSEFEIKTLLASGIRKADQILELESSSLLIDNSGDFIEFLEIELLVLKNTSDLKSEMKKLNVEFTERADFIEIHGYRN